MQSKKNVGSNLTNVAYEAIKDAIIDGKIREGDLLSENQIALKLGMSRTPVREALRMLVSEDIVEIKNNIGTYVRTFSRRDIEDIFEVRIALETIAAKTAVYEISEVEIDELERNFLTFLENSKNGIIIDRKEFINNDWKLHELLVERSRNLYVKNIIKSIHFSIKRFQFISFEMLNDVEESTAQHLNIIHYLRKRDPVGLAKALNEHIVFSENLILDRL